MLWKHAGSCRFLSRKRLNICEDVFFEWLFFFCILSWKKYEEAETPGYIHRHFNPMMIDNVQRRASKLFPITWPHRNHTASCPKIMSHPVTRSPGRWAPGGAPPSRSTRILQPWHGVLPASTVEQVAFLARPLPPPEVSSPRQQGRHCYGSSLATSQHLKNGKKSPKNIKSQSTDLTSSVLFWFQNTNFQTIWLSMYGQVLVGTSRKPDLYWFVPWHCPKSSPAPCMGFDSQSTIFRVTKNRCKSWCLSHLHHHCFPY